MRTHYIPSWGFSLLFAALLSGASSLYAQTSSCKSDGFFTLFGFCGNVTVELRCIGCTANGEALDFGGRSEGYVEVHFTKFSIANNCTNSSIKNFGRQYQLQLTPDCITGTAHLANPQISSALLVYNHDSRSFPQTAVVKYKTTGTNGRGKLQLKYHFNKRSTDAEGSTNFCFHCVEIPYTITGLGDPDEIAWNVVASQGAEEWCAFIKNKPSNRFVSEARRRLKSYEDSLWPRQSSTIKDYEDFKQKMRAACAEACTRCGEADQAIKRIEQQQKDDQYKQERAAFDSAKGNAGLYQKYITEYPKGRFVKEAKDSIARLTPIALEGPTESDAEGWRSIRFLNFVGAIQYKINPPLNDADIDASALQSEKVLRFKLTTSAQYSLYVQDSLYPWKNRTVSDLDNVFNAKLVHWDSLELKIFLDKGAPPYTIEWKDEKGVTGLSKTGLTAGEHRFSIDELLLSNLTSGTYKLFTSDQSTLEPLEIGAITIPSPNKKFPLWIILAVAGLVAVAAGGVIFVLVRRKKRQPGTIWDVD